MKIPKSIPVDGIYIIIYNDFNNRHHTQIVALKIKDFAL